MGFEDMGVRRCNASKYCASTESRHLKKVFGVYLWVKKRANISAMKTVTALKAFSRERRICEMHAVAKHLRQLRADILSRLSRIVVPNAVSLLGRK